MELYASCEITCDLGLSLPVSTLIYKIKCWIGIALSAEFIFQTIRTKLGTDITYREQCAEC